MKRRNTGQVWLECGLMLAAGLFVGASGQATKGPPVTDAAAQASPVRSTPAAPTVDSAAEASPVPSGTRGGLSIAPRTAIKVRLASAIDSGHLKNGDTVHATLANAVAISSHGAVNAGSPAELTVVETLPAGRIYAAGEFSLQLVRVGSISTSTDTLTYRGRPGHKELPDSAPAVGTDAGLPAGAELTFHVLPPPAVVNGTPRPRNRGPGSVDGVAVGEPSPRGAPSSAKPTDSTQPRH